MYDIYKHTDGKSTKSPINQQNQTDFFFTLLLFSFENSPSSCYADVVHFCVAASHRLSYASASSPAYTHHSIPG